MYSTHNISVWGYVWAGLKLQHSFQPQPWVPHLHTQQFQPEQVWLRQHLPNSQEYISERNSNCSKWSQISSIPCFWPGGFLQGANPAGFPAQGEVSDPRERGQNESWIPRAQGRLPWFKLQKSNVTP